MTTWTLTDPGIDPPATERTTTIKIPAGCYCLLPMPIYEGFESELAVEFRNGDKLTWQIEEKSMGAPYIAIEHNNGEQLATEFRRITHQEVEAEYGPS